MHTCSIDPNILKGKNKVKEAALPGSHCSAFGMEQGGQEVMVYACHDKSQPATSQDAHQTQWGPFGGCPSSKVTHPEALNPQTAISLVQNEDETSSAFSAMTENEDLLVREKYPARCSSRMKSHTALCTTRPGGCGAAARPALVLGTASSRLPCG